MNQTKWSENVILADADYIDRVAFDLTVNFERMLERRIPKANLAQWLECAAMDGGLKPLDPAGTPEAGSQRSVQVVLLHKQPEMQNFDPGQHEMLDGQAFTGPLGEFLISCVKVEELTTTDDLFMESLDLLANAPEVKRLLVVPDAPNIYTKVREALRRADDEKRITLLTMQPMEGGNFRQDILGYSLMAALGIRGEEIDRK
jgi:hypothetical protein